MKPAAFNLGRRALTLSVGLLAAGIGVGQDATVAAPRDWITSSAAVTTAKAASMLEQMTLKDTTRRARSVTVDSGASVVVTPGFWSRAGSEFRAHIAGPIGDPAPAGGGPSDSAQLAISGLQN